MNPKYKKTAKFIREARAKTKLSQKRFGIFVGIEDNPQVKIAQYESGSTSPPGWRILEIQQIMEKSNI